MVLAIENGDYVVKVKNFKREVLVPSVLILPLVKKYVSISSLLLKQDQFM